MPLSATDIASPHPRPAEEPWPMFYFTARLAVSLAASAGVQRPPTPTVDFIAAPFAAFSAVHSGSNKPPL